jgi:hypothetical protein
MKSNTPVKWIASLACTVSLALALAGCSTGAGGGPASTGGTSTSGSGASSFVEDTAASQTKTTSAKAGVSFLSSSAEGTAGLLAVAGAFPPNTKITFTPLKAGGDGVLAPGFKVTAEGGAQPQGPVFVVFAFKGAPPKGGVLVSYQEGATKGARIPASLSTTGGVTTAFAEVDHFTVFRWETDQGQAEADGSEQQENRIKSWTIQVNESTPMPDETGTWTSNWTLNMHASNPYGNILGPYNGTAKLGLKGTANLGPALKGSMSGSWSGPVHFDKGMVQVIYENNLGAPKAGEPDPQMGMLVRLDGEYTISSATPWKVRVAGSNMGGGFSAPVTKGGTYNLKMVIGDTGATVIFPGNIMFSGVPTAVLK